MPKTRNSIRKVSAPNGLINDLKNYQNPAIFMKEQEGDKWEGMNNHFFVSQHGMANHIIIQFLGHGFDVSSKEKNSNQFVFITYDIHLQHYLLIKVSTPKQFQAV